MKMTQFIIVPHRTDPTVVSAPCSFMGITISRRHSVDISDCDRWVFVLVTLRFIF